MLYLTVQNNSFLSKVESQANGWRELGYVVEVFNLQRTFSSLINFFRQVNNAEYVYVRFDYPVLRMWLFVVPFIYRKKIIIEIPTPLHIYFKELTFFKIHKLILMKCIYKFMFPLIAISANYIIEFGEEKSSLLKKYMDKVVVLENGIHSKDFYQLPVKYNFNDDAIIRFSEVLEFNIIIVANLTESHGLDRLLRSMYKYKMSQQIEVKYRVILHLVGRDTPTVFEVKKLIEELNLESHVIYYGQKRLENLAEVYKKANISIATLSAFKKGMFRGAFSLKAREAALMGLPSVFDYDDTEFEGTDLEIKIPANDNEIDMNYLIARYKTILDKHGNNLPYYISDHANTNFNWSNRFTRLNKIMS